MTKQSNEWPEEIQAALDDVRRVREVMDTVAGNHPFRTIIRPSLLLALYASPLIILYGIGAQWLVDQPGASYGGWSKTTLLWTSGLFLGVITKGIQFALFAQLSRKQGYDAARFVRRVFWKSGYFRLTFPFSIVCIAGSVALVQAGRADQVIPFVSAGVGALLLAYPIIFPVPEFDTLGPGLFCLIGGCIGMFVFPAYSFYKLAILWGGFCIWCGLLSFRFPKPEDT